MWKFKRRLNEKNKRNFLTVAISIVLLLVVFITIGFSAFQSSLDIGSIAATFRINKDIRITKISLDSATNNAISNWQDYNTTSISTNIDLPSRNSTITYEVEITNLGNIEMGILGISGLPSNLDYELTNYTLKDELCDYLDDSECKLGSVSKLLITLKYKNNGFDSSNTNYNVQLDFDFRRFYSITYVNLNSTNLPTKAIEGDNIEFTLNTPYPSSVHFDGTTNASYNANTGKININDINDDITISYLTMSYFVAYDGVNNQLFNQFSTTNIKSFSRNTTKTLSEVQAMVNNNTAYIISTSSTDPDYPSNNEIYGWVDNNNFYWWSEANVVYYHPYTLGAFRLMTNLTTVDLNGTNTSLVRNFAHWFDKDAKLTTINGKINTSGLVLEYNPNFNYGNDQDENASSGFGLTYMFNDCKILTSIDTSEITTTNSSDLKRMFGGCAKLTSLDVGHFDTHNARSMYWMFRKFEKVNELDLRSFDTSNVESMYGMFVNATGLETIYLGENFDTSKVKQFNRMFDSATNLKTIYAYNDFQLNSKVSDPSMFNNAKKLVGSANTLDATPYSSSYTTSSYAKLAHNGVKGYLTPYVTETYYTITYNLDGGSAVNPTMYNENTRTFTLVNPAKMGYTFVGWTGSNGDTPELTVTIEQGSSGDRTYTAHFEQNTVDMFPKVFAISGSCNFNGSTTNITGDTCVNDLDGTVYTNNTYIDTGIALYNNENLYQDFEISFEISNYVPSQQENNSGDNNQNTIMNSKTENQSTNPGVVFRRKGNQFEFRSFSTSANANYTSGATYKIARINRKIYTSVNGSAYTLIDDNSSFNSPFDLTVWFGASKNASGVPFRFTKCTLSNIYIKIGSFS